MVDKYGSQGFFVVGVTGEAEEPTLGYISETKTKAIIAYESKELPSMKAYGFSGFPSAALVGADGKVVWTGHPSALNDKLIEKALAGVKPGPLSDGLMMDVELPKKYAAIEKQLNGGKIGDGYKALAAALAAPGVNDSDRSALEAAKKQVDELGTAELKKAELANMEKRLFDAQVGWKRISTQMPGTDAGRIADGLLAELAKNAEAKRELEVGQRIADAQKLAAAGKAAAAASALSSILEGPMKDTVEAERAKKLLAEIKAKKG